MYWWCINERVIRGRGLPPHHPTTTVPIAVDGREAEEQLFHRSTEKKPIVPRKFTPFNKEDSNSCDALSFHFPVFHHEVGNERNPRSAGWFPFFFFCSSRSLSPKTIEHKRPKKFKRKKRGATLRRFAFFPSYQRDEKETNSHNNNEKEEVNPIRDISPPLLHILAMNSEYFTPPANEKKAQENTKEKTEAPKMVTRW